MENYRNLFMASLASFNRMNFFKNIGVQLVLTDWNFRPKIATMLKYQMEINDNIWFLYCRETRTQQILELVLAEINGALRRCM